MGGVSSTGLTVENVIQNLRQVLKEVEYGEVGLVFTLHQGMVVRIKQVRHTSCLLSPESEAGTTQCDQETEQDLRYEP